MVPIWCSSLHLLFFIFCSVYLQILEQWPNCIRHFLYFTSAESAASVLYKRQSLQESCNSSWSRQHKPTQPKWKSAEALDFGSIKAEDQQLHNVRLSPIHSLWNYTQIYQRHTKQISRPNMLNNQISGCYSSILSLCALTIILQHDHDEYFKCVKSHLLHLCVRMWYTPMTNLLPRCHARL